MLIGARLLDVDPLAVVLAAPALVGTLAIDLKNRRRLRINGRTVPAAGGFRLSVDQAYGNCPKYIQEQRRMIDTADTFFIASASTAGDADASHRGGNPGFVSSLSPQRVQWPDYEGNTMLMTLGNLTVNPAAGLLFIDWKVGRTLHLTGTAVIDWSADTAAEFPGAERTVEFQVAKVVPQREKITAVRSLRNSPLGMSDVMGESCEKSITIALRPKSSRSAVPANSEKTSRHPTTVPPLMRSKLNRMKLGARLHVARMQNLVKQSHSD
ncbi:pyridoxamine 5'-phosphate oxidase family protein [Streptomyces sp. NPDC048254]|uniref:pyridoxamine 5'-phosphate oxidase family protein n=1 Tax=Streptomyces sp. NPDC048254 TaxID=3365525 RepID=UPI0037218241